MLSFLCVLCGSQKKVWISHPIAQCRVPIARFSKTYFIFKLCGF